MIEKVKKICSCEEEVDLTKLNTFRLASKCMCLAHPKNEDELFELVKLLKKEKVKYFVMGNASNIILPQYYNGVVIKLDKFKEYEIHDDYVYAQCGVMLNKLASIVTDKGYAGLDFATGIPGTVGGSVYCNAGCFGSEISKILISARVYEDGEIKEYSWDDFKFEYRASILKRENSDAIILSCKLRIEKGNRDELLALVKERTEKRKATQDIEHPSNGSIFRNPEGFAAAGKLIEDAGLKGYSVNDIMVSYKHANFIINNGKGTQEDVIKIIKKIQKDVKKSFGADLHLEQEIIK